MRAPRLPQGFAVACFKEMQCRLGPNKCSAVVAVSHVLTVCPGIDAHWNVQVSITHGNKAHVLFLLLHLCPTLTRAPRWSCRICPTLLMVVSLRKRC